jgi:hypothetical protein
MSKAGSVPTAFLSDLTRLALNHPLTDPGRPPAVAASIKKMEIHQDGPPWRTVKPWRVFRQPEEGFLAPSDNGRQPRRKINRGRTGKWTCKPEEREENREKDIK